MYTFNKHSNALRCARVARVANARANAHKGAYLLAVQQLAAQYGIAVPTTLSVRSTGNTQVHAPSAVQGACAIVRGLVAANPTFTRKQVLALAQQQGINPATAATQYALAKRAQ